MSELQDTQNQSYPDEFDLIFRNETAAVKRRAHRASNASQKTISPRSTRSLQPQDYKEPRSTPRSRKRVDSSVDLSPVWDGAVLKFSPASDPIGLFEENKYPGTSSIKPWERTLPFDGQSSPELPSIDSVLSREIVVVTPPTSYGVAPSVCEALLSPRSMDTPAMRVDVSVAFWFKHLLRIPRLPDALRGYMEILGPMYMQASANSLLHQATHALSLAALSNGQRSPLIRMEARRLYTIALRYTGEAICDPKQARSNELLMSILLFSLYETITSTDDSRRLWTRHINGAVTLVKMRGEAMKNDPLSLHLFRAVRAHMLTATIQQEKMVEDFPSEKGWHFDENMDVNAANRLTMICIDLPNIKYYAKDILGREKSANTVIEMMTLISVAETTDSALQHWSLTLDEVWQPRVKMHILMEPEDLQTASCWKGPVHVYNDLSVASVWNDYRISRIFCQAVILGCVAAIPQYMRTAQVQLAADQAVDITQQMVDDFSSSVPFLFGLPSEFEAKKISRLDQVALRASGAYHAAWPLWVMKSTPTVPEKQREWLAARLASIGRTWGLSEDQMLNLAQRHAMSTGPQFSYEEYGDFRSAPTSTRPCSVEYSSPLAVDMGHLNGGGRHVA